jgi:hypothetical protein
MWETLSRKIVSRLTLVLFVAFVLLSQMVAPAKADPADLDPACLPTGETGGRASSRGPALKILGSCTKLYCNESAKASNRDNVKFIEETLLTYQARNEAFSRAVDEYQAACRVLVKNFCQACATMDRVNSAVLRIQMTGAEIEESAALLRFQENFAFFGRVVARDENDLACSSQIKSSSTKAVELHSANVLRFANTKCDK